MKRTAAMVGGCRWVKIAAKNCVIADCLASSHDEASQREVAARRCGVEDPRQLLGIACLPVQTAVESNRVSAGTGVGEINRPAQRREPRRPGWCCLQRYPRQTCW